MVTGLIVSVKRLSRQQKIKDMNISWHYTDLAGLNVLKFGIESKRGSKETSTDKFRLAVIEALREMRKICEQGVLSHSSSETHTASASLNPSTSAKL